MRSYSYFMHISLFNLLNFEQSDCHVRLQKKEDLDLEKLKTTVQDAMSSGSVNLRQLRCYITVLENLDYDLTQDMQKVYEFTASLFT